MDASIVDADPQPCYSLLLGMELIVSTIGVIHSITATNCNSQQNTGFAYYYGPSSGATLGVAPCPSSIMSLRFSKYRNVMETSNLVET